MEISILLLTYNHEKFIRQALDSIIMQKINVSYEIIILDDASTDGTPKILKEYKQKYPQIITLYLRKFNNGYPTKNSFFMLSKAKGRYYAFLDGDDYWIDELKIQKQYDFLENYKDYAGCMTNLIIVDEDNHRLKQNYYDDVEDCIHTLEDFKYLRKPSVTASFFARNYFIKEDYKILYEADRMMGDITIYMLSLMKGKIYQFGETMAAYRRIQIAGKTNFNSIHQSNKYRNYIQARYLIRLENYMQQCDNKFRFMIMNGIIQELAVEYPIKPAIALLMEARQRKEYLLIYSVYKLLLDSVFLAERRVVRESVNYRSWNNFTRVKKPIVLFGAGAVAREYIDKYAWKDNLSFLVDNNLQKQNTSMKGYIIKRPEEILKLKDKVCVLITNKDFERDIEAQLQKMGVKNYYCYCSMQARRMRNRVACAIFKYLDFEI